MPDNGRVQRGAPGEASSPLRNRLQAALAKGRTHEALHAARALLSAHPEIRIFRHVRRLVEAHRQSLAQARPMRVALLANFSIEFVQDSLIAYGLADGLLIDIYQPGFGQVRQEVLSPDSQLYAAGPDAVVIALEGADAVPALYGGYLAAGDDGVETAVRNFAAEMSELIAAFRRTSTAPILVHDLAPPRIPSLGVLDAKLACGQGHAIARANAALAEVARDHADVHVVGYAALVGRHGAMRWYDPRMWHYARQPIAQDVVHHLSREYMRFLRAIAGLNRKCLVVDLDNTLWGGILGEDGVDGIALGPHYPGSAYVEFQAALVDLHRRGVILAVASKNNPADVDDAFSRHPAMVLKKDHFSALEVGWGVKSESLAAISRRLGIGLEHMVFADDNPAEIEQVRAALPMVTTVALPAQPERYVDALLADGWFDTLQISAEDRRRSELYRQRAAAEAARASSVSLEDYYLSLEMSLRIRPVDRTSIPRAAQLTQKTNQFTATTRRYNESEVSLRADDPDWVTFTVAVRDRFGDNGIVGLAMARVDGPSLRIDTFLLSCRVIGRGVESAMLAYLCQVARQRGLAELTGEIIPTPKNLPIHDLYERHRFVFVPANGDRHSYWRLALASAGVETPEWFRIEP